MKQKLFAMTAASLMALSLVACTTTEPEVQPKPVPDTDIAGTRYDINRNMNYGMNTPMDGGVPRGTSNSYYQNRADITMPRPHYSSKQTGQSMMKDSKYYANGAGDVKDKLPKANEKLERGNMMDKARQMTNDAKNGIDDIGRSLENMTGMN